MSCLVLAVCLLDLTLMPPPVEEMPLSITSYWMFDDAGQPVAWNGQADGDPTVYANMYPTSPEHASKVGACISEWVRLDWTTAVSFTWQGEPMTIHCYDAFGAVAYRAPFYHAGYEQWVIPVDVLSPLPYHGLVWGWETAVSQVGEW